VLSTNNGAASGTKLRSTAAERPAEVAAWLRRFGPERLCLAFDVRLDRALDLVAGQFALVSVPGIRGARAYSIVNGAPAEVMCIDADAARLAERLMSKIEAERSAARR